MNQFQTIEDYIEVIAGERDPTTGKLIGGWLNDPIINLARYDVRVIDKMSEQVMAGIALTERQAELAQKLILNYRRQLAHKGVDVDPVKKPVYRNPLRTLDYTSRLTIEDNLLCLKFPYQTHLIEQLRSFAKESQGTCRWSRDDRLWKVDLTEYNLNWVHTFATINKFEIDYEVDKLVKLLLAVEETGYSIELTVVDNNLQLNNAPDSLVQYVNQHIGELTFDNLLKLSDYSSILGYTLNNSLSTAIAQEYGYRFLHLLTNKELKLDPGSMFVEDNFSSIIDYAIMCDRLPVYVYEPDLNFRLLKKLQEMFDENEILEIKNKRVPELIDSKVKVVYSVKPFSHSLPLLVSAMGMIYGGEKELMMQQAEKIVYCTAEVYNKRNTGVKNFAG